MKNQTKQMKFFRQAASKALRLTTGMGALKRMINRQMRHVPSFNPQPHTTELVNTVKELQRTLRLISKSTRRTKVFKPLVENITVFVKKLAKLLEDLGKECSNDELNNWLLKLIIFLNHNNEQIERLKEKAGFIYDTHIVKCPLEATENCACTIVLGMLLNLQKVLDQTEVEASEHMCNMRLRKHNLPVSSRAGV